MASKKRVNEDDDRGTPQSTLSPAATPEPALGARPLNIKFCGRRQMDRQKRKVLRPNAPIESFVAGGREIKLPSADFQIRNRLFYHESAALITRLFPHLYKKLKHRG